MSELWLVVREATQDWSGAIHGSSADRAIAALSADPTTLAELEVACARFANPVANHPFFANLSRGLRDEPYDAGLVVIDLVARLVVVDSTYSWPGLSGTVCYHDGQRATDKWLPYHLAEDWLLISDRVQWPAVAEKRRRERAARSLLDARSVFYGRPLSEFVARQTFAAFVQQMAISVPQTVENPGTSRGQTDEEIVYDTLKQIHADWLLTPREDLDGACPRDVAFKQRDHLGWDLQDQCSRWSRLGKCPPGLDPSSFAFRYGGFGTHELVQYYDLVRELLWSCWQRLDELRKAQPAAGGLETLAVGDFLSSEVPRLERMRDQWFETPDPEFHGRTPRAIIDRERARLPEAVSVDEAMHDADCPCCQMPADMPGPTFWHLDGSGMDDDFAFDIWHQTRDEWDAEERRWEEHRRQFDANANADARLGVSDASRGALDDQSAWSTSLSEADAPGVPLFVRLFGIGCALSELIDAIRGDVAGRSAAPEAQRLIDQLNHDFGNLRDVLQTDAPTLTDALLEPVVDRFCESLAAVALARPDLSAKCESLTSNIAGFRDPGPSESSWDSGEWDDPF